MLTRILAVFLILAGIVSWSLPAVTQADAQEPAGALRLVALNIGKADCLLLLWEDHAYLIDAGYEQTYPALETMLSQYGVTHLDGVFLTHCHKDHFGGMAALAQSKITIGSWYASEIYYDVKPGQHPAALAAASRGMTVTYLTAGDQIPAGSGGAFQVLGPVAVSEDNENNNSLVLRFSCPAGSVLLAGDMKEDEEYDLLRAGAFEKTDVLKVGHHGDSKASTLNMLRAVQPRVSLILTSTQEEADTPARGTLNRLAAVGSQVFVSQDARDAWQVTLENGGVTVEDVAWQGVPARAEGISLHMDVDNDLLTIENQGTSPLSLKGCRLYSSRGDDLLTLPEDGVIAPGGRYTVGSRATQGSVDCLWNIKRVWHQKKLDTAILYDAFGRPLACTDNGFSE